MEVWRGRLWAKALEQQGVVDGGLGNTLQKNFTTYRTARFQFSQDVAVRCSNSGAILMKPL